MENIENLKKFWNKKKVFVTGHTGFKGSWLCIILKYLKSNQSISHSILIQTE